MSNSIVKIFKISYKFDSELEEALKVRIAEYEKQHSCQYLQISVLNDKESEEIPEYRTASVIVMFR